MNALYLLLARLTTVLCEILSWCFKFHVTLWTLLVWDSEWNINMKNMQI